ncbi:hypothetical protein ACLOJK_033220 [Asimina triloba]
MNWIKPTQRVNGNYTVSDKNLLVCIIVLKRTWSFSFQQISERRLPSRFSFFGNKCASGRKIRFLLPCFKAGKANYWVSEGMGRVSLSHFPGFMIKTKNQSSGPSDETSRFYTFLSKEIEKLEGSFSDGFVSLRWSAEAMVVLKKMHSEFLLYVERSRLPISSKGEDWFDEYMKESVNLLDFCNMLRSAASGLERYRMAVEFMTRRLKDGASSEIQKMEIERVEGESEKMPAAIKKWGDAGWKKREKGINSIMFSLRGTAMIISSLLLSAFISTASVDVSGELGHEFSQLGPFGSSLIALAHRCRDGIQATNTNSGMGLIEYNMVERAINDLKTQVAEGMVEDREKVARSVDVLRHRCLALKEGLEIFGCAVNEVFEEVIRGRNKLVRITTYRVACSNDDVCLVSIV